MLLPKKNKCIGYIFAEKVFKTILPTQIGKPLTVIKHLVASPLDDKDKSYYTALAKQSHSYNELLFMSAKSIPYMVQTENKAEHKPPPIELISPIRNTSEKLSSVLE